MHLHFHVHMHLCACSHASEARKNSLPIPLFLAILGGETLITSRTQKTVLYVHLVAYSYTDSFLIIICIYFAIPEHIDLFIHRYVSKIICIYFNFHMHLDFPIQIHTAIFIYVYSLFTSIYTSILKQYIFAFPYASVFLITCIDIFWLICIYFDRILCVLESQWNSLNWHKWPSVTSFKLIDFHYNIKNSPVALLETLCARGLIFSV